MHSSALLSRFCQMALGVAEHMSSSGSTCRYSGSLFGVNAAATLGCFNVQGSGDSVFKRFKVVGWEEYTGPCGVAIFKDMESHPFLDFGGHVGKSFGSEFH